MNGILMSVLVKYSSRSSNISPWLRSMGVTATSRPFRFDPHQLLLRPEVMEIAGGEDDGVDFNNCFQKKKTHEWDLNTKHLEKWFDENTRNKVGLFRVRKQLIVSKRRDDDGKIQLGLLPQKLQRFR